MAKLTKLAMLSLIAVIWWQSCVEKDAYDLCIILLVLGPFQYVSGFIFFGNSGYTFSFLLITKIFKVFLNFNSYFLQENEN